MTKKPTVTTVKPHDNQAYKNLCHHGDFIQDFSTYPSVRDKFLLKLYIAELFAICSIEKIFKFFYKRFLNRLG